MQSVVLKSGHFFTCATKIMHFWQWKRGSCCSSRFERLIFLMHSFIPRSIPSPWKTGGLLLSDCSVFNLSDARLNRLQLTPIGEQPPSLHWVTATPNAINQRGISNQPSSACVRADLSVGRPSYVWLSTENKWNTTNVFRTNTERTGLKGCLWRGGKQH